MEILEYSLWQNFYKTINIAVKNCNNSNYDVSDHFIDANKMIKIAKNARREIQDYKLSRYACYLIVLNCDPRKKIIALAKTYFAIQTRKQELSEKEHNEAPATTGGVTYNKPVDSNESTQTDEPLQSCESTQLDEPDKSAESSPAFIDVKEAVRSFKYHDTVPLKDELTKEIDNDIDRVIALLRDI